MIFYGMARETFDTDIVVDIWVGRAGTSRLLDTLAEQRYQPYGVGTRLDEAGFLARPHVIFTRQDNVVDVWTEPAGWGLEMLGRRIRARTSELEVGIAHVDDLLRMKSALKRDKDRQDLILPRIAYIRPESVRVPRERRRRAERDAEHHLI